MASHVPTKMIMTLHINNNLSDYVLDLLPVPQRQQIENHAADCADCRADLQTERLFAQNVRQTIIALPQPDMARLAALQPRLKRRPAPFYSLQRAAVGFAMAVFMFVGLFGMQGLGSGAAEASPVPAVAATTTVTLEPTAVATATQVAMFNHYQPIPTPAPSHDQK